MSSPSPSLEKLAQARRATFFSFLLLGHLVLCSVAWVPEYIDRLGVSFTQWGLILGVAPLGAIVSIAVSPLLVNRFGVGRVVFVASLISCGFLVSLGFTTSPGLWMVLNMMFNFAVSLAGVGVNTQAVLVQKKFPTPIINGMHAGWSMGAVAAAVTGSVATATVSLETYLIAIALITAASFVFTFRYFLTPAEDGHREERHHATRLPLFRLPLRMWVLAFGLVCAAVAEISIFEWSAVLARQLGADLLLRSLPFGVFMAGMIIGRLSIARLARAFSVKSLATAGAAMGSLAMALGIVMGYLIAPYSPLWAILILSAFWLFAGLGVAPLGPTMISSASALRGVTTTQAIGSLSMVSHVGSIGAKISMGALAEGVSVSMAFAIPIILLLGAVLVARWALRPHYNPDLDSVAPPTGPLPIVTAGS